MTKGVHEHPFLIPERFPPLRTPASTGVLILTDKTITRKLYGVAANPPMPPFGGFGGGATPPLVTVTKTASPSQPDLLRKSPSAQATVKPTASPQQFFTDEKTGEIIGYSFAQNGSIKLDKPSHQTRAQRWALKSVVNKLLPQSRTAKCMRLLAPVAGSGLSVIQVHKTAATGKAFYTGLMSCGSVWNCPVCAAKVSERRRGELAQAMDAARRLGYRIHFVTLTIPHGIGDDLSKMKDLQQKALRRLSSGKNSIKSILLRNDIEQHGYIRTYEITHGKQNGFHPHFHILLFTSPNVTHQQIQDLYAPAWQKACLAVGLPRPSDKHGCTVQDGTKAADYAAKWGLEDEMTKANTKVTKRKGTTPWGLLKAVLDSDNPDYPPEYAERVFRAYSKCMTGARQLYWSNGLRAKFALAPEMTDEQLAEKITDETSTHLADVSMEQWKAIRKAKAEPHILTAAESLPEGSHKILAEIINGYYVRYVSKPEREGTAPAGGLPAGVILSPG